MLREELSMCCKIPLEVLKEYERWGLYADVGKVQGNWQYDDRDIRYLSVIMTLYDIGFEGGETETYMRLLLQGSQTADQRLRMLNQRRKAILDEIHSREERLQQLDYFRHLLQNGNPLEKGTGKRAESFRRL